MKQGVTVVFTRTYVHLIAKTSIESDASLKHL